MNGKKRKLNIIMSSNNKGNKKGGKRGKNGVSGGPENGSHGECTENEVLVDPLELPDNLFALINEKEFEPIGRTFVVFAHSSADLSLRYVKDLKERVLKQATGVLVVQKQAGMLFVEGPSTILVELIGQIRKEIIADESPLESVRVVSFCDDVPERLFKVWVEQSLGLAKETAIDLGEDADNINQVLVDAHTRCVGLAAKLTHGEKNLDNIKTRYQNLLLSNERLLTLATHDAVMTLDDFHGLYGCPVNHTSIQSEVWPVQDITMDL